MIEVLDQWTPVSYKREMGPQARIHPPSWVGEEARRLRAYMIFSMYLSNVARELLNVDDEEIKEDHREYGDPHQIAKTITSAVLGENQTIHVPGADDEDSEAHELLEWLNRWAESDGLFVKLPEEEYDAVSLGDGVMYMGWSEEKRRAVIHVCDPGFYFPVLETDDEEFPNKVHVAWEEGDGPERKVRRITWELVPLQPRLETNEEAKARLGLGRFGFVREADRLEIVPEGWRLEEDGRWSTSYPWTDDDERSFYTCLMTDAEFKLGRTKRGPQDFDETKAEYRVDRLGPIKNRDLGIDFIPVVHVPNTPSSKTHFGESSLGHVLQIFDDLATTDTDLQKASATAGSPVITLSGASMGGQKIGYTPGQVLELGSEGKMGVMSTADALDPLLKLNDALASRLSRNSNVSEALMGRIKPSEVPSGIALALGFAPMTALIRELRLTRGRVHPLILKFAWRLAASAGEDVPEWVRGTVLELGAYLPIDRTSVVNEIRELLAVDGISRFTAVQVLQSIGYSIEDAAEEVDRIIEEVRALNKSSPSEAGSESPAEEQEEEQEQ